MVKYISIGQNCASVSNLVRNTIIKNKKMEEKHVFLI